MKQFLSRFRDIPRGAPLRAIFTADWAAAVQDMLRALAQGENITVEGGARVNRGDGAVRIGLREAGGNSGRGARPPFDVILHRSGPAGNLTYEVTVTPGYVCERVPGAGDAVKNHEPWNVWPKPVEGEVSKLERHAIIPGQAVYIMVKVKADGTVGIEDDEVDPEDEEAGVDKSVAVTVDADDKSSTHYQPRVDNETSDGVRGTYYYKLVVLEEGEGDQPCKLTRFLAGSHLEHYQELPTVRTTVGVADGIGVIPKKWDDEGRAFKFRALTKGLGKLNVTTESDLVEVRGNKRAVNLRIERGGSPESEPQIDFRDGLCESGTEIVGDEETPPAPEDKVIRIPIVQSRDDAPPQIHVENPDGQGDVYIVKGNDKEGYLEVTISGEPGFTLEWKDGLVVSDSIGPIAIDGGGNGIDGSLVITVNGSGGATVNWANGYVTTPGNQIFDIVTDALPPGVEGNLMVHDGTGWVALANPVAPSGSNKTFLTHTGTTPVWLELEAKEIQICESGTSVTKTIYVEI